MVIGVKCADQLAANHIPVMFSKGKYTWNWSWLHPQELIDISNRRLTKGKRVEL